ncbi:MAG: sarcosine oxidase subunit delta [Pseudomonadota bacterium]
MRINCPCCGLRMVEEFTYLGDAAMMNRPEGGASYEYTYLRDNPAGRHRELWYHEQGCRSWLVVERDTTTHEIFSVELAEEVTNAV